MHKILIVDDALFMRDMIRRALEPLGFDIAGEAGNGGEAIEKYKEIQPDLVTMDIIMPEMDGYKVLEQLKLDKNLRDIPVVVVSALDDIESVVRCIEMGAEDYLPKSFDPVLLRARIGICLEKKRLRDQETLLAENLREKSNALEQLSNQLAKYLSPQCPSSNDLRRKTV